MPKEIAQSIWADLMCDGTPGQIISFIWERIMENGTLVAFILMLWTLALRLVLISFYFSLLYFGITHIKKRLHQKLSARTNYDCWYILLFSVVLANLPFNNRIMALPSYLLNILDSQGYKSYAFFAACLLSVAWLAIVIFKLAVLARMNRKIRKSMKCMERYDDNEGFAERAASALGLRRKPDIMIACYIETPVSYGLFKKTVLLPDDYESKYSPCELYLLLLHEMTHIKHGDTAKLYIVSLAECFLWITPAMRLFVKSFKRDSEILCDNRVIGLQESERDTYGKLILKECAYKTARFGFGFSDSYQAIENRLDALYRYKAKGHLKLLAIVPAVVLTICALTYVFRADWLVVNDKYNSEFRLAVLDTDSGDYIPLPPDVCSELYNIIDTPLGYSSFCIDENALREVVGQYAVDGIITMEAVSDNYAVQTGETAFSFGFNLEQQISAEALEDEEFVVVLSSGHLRERSLAEYLFLFITSKL